MSTASAFQTKVIFYRGDEIQLKSKVTKGAVSLDDEQLRFEGSDCFAIPLSQIRSVTYHTLKGLGKLVQIDTSDQTVYVAAVSFAFWFMASIQRAKTQQLHDLLLPESTASSGVRSPAKYSGGEREITTTEGSPDV